MKILINKNCIKNSTLTHYDNGDDNMNKNDLWLLFTKTGKIEYYLKYKKMEDQEMKND